MNLRPVGREHRSALAAFECATAGLECTLEIEQLIRGAVPGQLDAGQVEALGSWHGTELAAVIVFVRRPPHWRVDLLATSIRYRQQKQAFRLLAEVTSLAREGEAAAVACDVHVDNSPMRALLREKFQAVFSPREGVPYELWTIPASSFKQIGRA